MKERPILMSSPMILSLLDGSKTQTRRIVKPAPIFGDVAGLFACWKFRKSAKAFKSFLWPNAKPEILGMCPYGQPGDRLWVREAFSGPHCMESSEDCAAVPPGKWATCSSIWYWADGEPDEGDWTRPRPSIHMPRWASRILLEVVSVRVERLNEIGEADAMAEGIQPELDGWLDYSNPSVQMCMSPIDSYRTLWEKINGADSWALNPWVWVVTFKRIFD